MSILVHQLALGAMDNFVYVIEDDVSKSCVIVDPAWDVTAIIECIQSRDLELVYILLTHGHFDHTDGLADCLAYKEVPVYMSKQELPKLIPNQQNLIFTNDNDVIPFGSNRIKIMHTPGHSPGGQCFHIDDHLITGDTLFINGCGRCDLGGSSIDDMYESLERIKSLPDDTLIYPGHHYDDKPIDTLINQKKTNRFLLCQNKDEFIRKRSRKK